jgi:hypothetical protein
VIFLVLIIDDLLDIACPPVPGMAGGEFGYRLLFIWLTNSSVLHIVHELWNQ